MKMKMAHAQRRNAMSDKPPAPEITAKIPKQIGGPGSPIGDEAVKNGIDDPAWVPKRLSKLSIESAKIPWVWESYLARGFTTVFTGLWKSGKTTMTCHLLKALDGHTKTFCGRSVTKA